MNKKPKATVDGREVEVEIIDSRLRGNDTQKEPHEETGPILRIQSMIPFMVTGIILVGIAILSITLFIRLIPILVPIFLIWLIIKMVRSYI